MSASEGSFLFQFIKLILKLNNKLSLNLNRCLATACIHLHVHVHVHTCMYMYMCMYTVPFLVPKAWLVTLVVHLCDTTCLQKYMYM